ncbi:unnamed protein product, partial [marine sediment metagenome]
MSLESFARIYLKYPPLIDRGIAQDELWHFLFRLC